MIEDRYVDYIKNLTGLVQGKLIIGNHETISLLGSEEQQRLGGICRDIANVCVNQKTDIEKIIQRLIEEMNAIEKLHTSSQNVPFVHKNKVPQSVVIGHSNAILNDLGNLKVQLQLQDIHIHKESFLLERLASQLSLCRENLQRCLDQAKTIIDQHQNKAIISEDTAYWWKRLENRILDLETSYLITAQSIEQIRLLDSNNQMICNRIQQYLNHTLPVLEEQLKLYLSLMNDKDQSILWESINKEILLLLELEHKDYGIRQELKQVSS